MRMRRKRKGESTDQRSTPHGVPGRHHYEYAPPAGNPQGKTDAARSHSSIDARGQAHALRPPDSGAVKSRSVKE
jgi:hypothetical protein